MQYHLDLCNPETWQAFTDAGATRTGFAARRRRVASERVKPGDIFLCYMTRLSRWCGVLEVESGPFNDDTPLFGTTDPYPIRFNVKPIVILSTESAVPIHEPEVWQTLSITKRFQSGEQGWTGFFRQPLNTLEDEDGRFLEELLKNQQANPKAYPLSDADLRNSGRSRRSSRRPARSRSSSRTPRKKNLPPTENQRKPTNYSTSWNPRSTRPKRPGSVSRWLPRLAAKKRQSPRHGTHPAGPP